MSAAAVWRTDAPPRDGRAIAAIVRVSWSDEISGGVESFLGEICWRGVGQDAGWRHAQTDLSVARMVEDVVHIYWWAPLPDGYAEGAR